MLSSLVFHRPLFPVHWIIILCDKNTRLIFLSLNLSNIDDFHVKVGISFLSRLGHKCLTSLATCPSLIEPYEWTCPHLVWFGDCQDVHKSALPCLLSFSSSMAYNHTCTEYTLLGHSSRPAIHIYFKNGQYLFCISTMGECCFQKFSCYLMSPYRFPWTNYIYASIWDKGASNTRPPPYRLSIHHWRLAWLLNGAAVNWERISYNPLRNSTHHPSPSPTI